MFQKILLVALLLLLAASVFGWGQAYLNVPVSHAVTIGSKTVEMGEVEVAGRSCIIAVRGDAIAIDCD